MNFASDVPSDKCINWPCQLKRGHPGRCETSPPEDDEEERDDSPYCDCGSFPGEEEEASNRCSCCGKRIDP